MSELWNYLTAPENRDMLTWLGGGLVVVCGGIWTVLTFFMSQKPPKGNNEAAPKPQRARSSRVTAKSGGIAGGRDVKISTQTGMRPDQVILLVLAILGALLIAVTQAGNRVTVSNGIGVGGDVEGSTVTIEE